MSPASSPSCGSEWRWTGRAAELIRRRIRGSLFAVPDALSSPHGRQEEVDEPFGVAAHPRGARTAGALDERDLLRAGEAAQPALADQRLVHRPGATLERGPRGRAERHGLAVHRA